MTLIDALLVSPYHIAYHERLKHRVACLRHQRSEAGKRDRQLGAQSMKLLEDGLVVMDDFLDTPIVDRISAIA